jgi:hypothetical protein
MHAIDSDPVTVDLSEASEADRLGGFDSDSDAGSASQTESQSSRSDASSETASDAGSVEDDPDRAGNRSAALHVGPQRTASDISCCAIQCYLPHSRPLCLINAV